MAAVLLTKDQERQVRMLRYERTVEAEYREMAANERLRRIRVVMVLLVLLMLPKAHQSDQIGAIERDAVNHEVGSLAV